MAALTADRTDVLELNSVASLPWLATAGSLTVYRGSAVAAVVEGTGEGTLTKTVTGTVAAQFLGVAKRQFVITSSSTGHQLELPLKRDGVVSFNLVNAAGTSVAAAATDLGKLVWFRTDNEVSLTPPSAAYPICAGRVVGYSSMTGYTQLSSTQVAVDISEAVGNHLSRVQKMSFIMDCAVISSDDITYVSAYTLARRIWAIRAIYQIGIAVAGGSLVSSVKKNSTDIFTDSAVTGTVGAITAVNVYTLFDTDDTLTIRGKSSANLTAGLVNVTLEYVDLA